MCWRGSTVSACLWRSPSREIVRTRFGPCMIGFEARVAFDTTAARCQGASRRDLGSNRGYLRVPIEHRHFEPVFVRPSPIDAIKTQVYLDCGGRGEAWCHRLVIRGTANRGGRAALSRPRLVRTLEQRITRRLCFNGEPAARVATSKFGLVERARANYWSEREQRGLIVDEEVGATRNDAPAEGTQGAALHATPAQQDCYRSARRYRSRRRKRSVHW